MFHIIQATIRSISVDRRPKSRQTSTKSIQTPPGGRDARHINYQLGNERKSFDSIERALGGIPAQVTGASGAVIYKCTYTLNSNKSLSYLTKYLLPINSFGSFPSRYCKKIGSAQKTRTLFTYVFSKMLYNNLYNGTIYKLSLLYQQQCFVPIININHKSFSHPKIAPRHSSCDVPSTSRHIKYSLREC